MSRLIIYGAGGFGREVLKHVRRLAIEQDRSIAFASDDGAQVGTLLAGLPVISPRAFNADDRCTIAVANSTYRRAMTERCPGFFSVVGGFASLYEGVSLGEGAIISDFASIGADELTSIGRHFQINTHSTVGHDCQIGDFVTIGPHVGVSGNVVIGDDAHIGSGAQIMNGVPGKPLRIGAGATVGIGAVVLRDVPAGATVFGNPAKVVMRAVEDRAHAA